MEAPHRRDPAGRDRRAQCRAGETVPCRRRRHRLRRHRHHAQRRSGGARARMDRGDAAGVNAKAADRADHRRLGFGRRRGDSGGSQDLRRARRLWRERGHRAHRPEHARRARRSTIRRLASSARRSRRCSRISRSRRSRSACWAARRSPAWWRKTSLSPSERLPRERRRLAPETAAGPSFHRLRSGHDRLLRRRAERRGLRRGDHPQAASARRLPDPQPRGGRGAARRADRAERRGHGAPGRGAAEARARARF